MNVPDPFPTVAKLAGEHGFSWPHYAKTARETARVENLLRTVLEVVSGDKRLLDPDSSLVLCGSFARHEMVTGSDCDWTLLINGVVNNQHADVARQIDRAIRQAEKNKLGLKSPGTSGTFGNLTFSHDLVHRIGGSRDSNENLTRRMLMLLESRPFSLSSTDASDQVWNAVLKSILERYFEEDVHFKPDSQHVPRFLLNDLTRYWRTICVDYAAKYREQDGRKWAVRNAKLRFSRKLLFAAGLAFCFSCDLSPPKQGQHDLFGVTWDKSATPFIEAAMDFARKPPLEYLASFVDRFIAEPERRRKVCERIFGAYDAWLGLLGTNTTREKLEDLTHENALADETFQRVREQGATFAAGHQLLFFNREKDADEIADLSLRYIGF